MGCLTPILFAAGLLALCSAVPFRLRPRISFTLPQEKALLQRVTVSWGNRQKAIMQEVLDDLNDDERAILQSISISWQNKQKAFMQSLLQDLSDEEKAALQRISVTIGGQERANLQQVRFQPTLHASHGEAGAERLKTNDYIDILSSLASNVAQRINDNKKQGDNAPSLTTSDVLTLLSDVGSKVADRLNSNGEGGTAMEENFDIGDAIKAADALNTLFGG